MRGAIFRNRNRFFRKCNLLFAASGVYYCGMKITLLAVLVVHAAIASAQTSKTDYMDVMEAAVSAYSDARLVGLTETAERDGVQEHGFPRLAANLGFLVANGRLAEKKPLLARMMTVCCRDAAKGPMPVRSSGNEFSVKELVWALVQLEAARTYEKSVTDAWRADLARIDARASYRTGRLSLGERRAHNWVVFACASEQARLAHGLGGDAAFVERYVADQLRWFDENGMYRDPNAPAVYDFVTRLQFMHILDDGYDGPSRPQLEALLARAAEPTLRIQSACGEIPFGGRSNQFLHNNTFDAAVCEWYAARFAKRGDLVRANLYKRAARRALDDLRPWLAQKPVRHVKNAYPRASAQDGLSLKPDVGCEDYAYFDKYMVTMGSWAMGAFLFCADVPSVALPPEDPFVFATSPDFHQILLSSGDYSAQFDWNANPAYDATGLGRLQRRGAPPAICLSTPCAKAAHYRRERADGGDLAIRPVVPDGTSLVLTARYATKDLAVVDWRVGGCDWRCTLTKDGLLSELTGEGALALALPAFESDGSRATDVSCDGRTLEVAYGGWVCRSRVEGGTIVRTEAVTSNRSGRYRRYEARGTGKLAVRIVIEPVAATVSHVRFSYMDFHFSDIAAQAAHLL